MMDSTTRENIYRQVESHFPLVQETIPRFGKRPGGSPIRFDEPLSLTFHKRLDGLTRRLQSELLFHLHTLFHFDGPGERVKTALQAALGHLYERERMVEKAPNDSLDAHDHALLLLRSCWHRHRPKGDTDTLVTGLAHLQQAGFFVKEPQEIARWTQVFLHVERYHRLDPERHEERLDRYRYLLAGTDPIHQLDDLLVWLEQELLQHPDEPLGSLSRKSALRLHDRLAIQWSEDGDIPSCLYLLLRCHQLCLTETIAPADQLRLQELHSSRRLDSLVDLMLLVLDLSLGRNPLPECGNLLDELQRQGFNIEHKAFRDPYEASLVPVNEIQRFESTPLRLFLSLASLSGNYHEDLQAARQRFEIEHQRIVKELVQEQEAYRRALRQPLPEGRLLRRLVSYCAGWALSRSGWPPAVEPRQLAEAAAEIFPAEARTLLVRPRKGYELSSRVALNQMLEHQCRIHSDSLERIAKARAVNGLFDYRHFVRYLLLKGLGQPEQAIQMNADAAQVLEYASESGVTQMRPAADSPAVVRAYLDRQIPCHELISGLIHRFDMSEQELEQIYLELQEQLSSTFYKLTTAYGRHLEQQSRISAEVEEIERFVTVLAPPLVHLQEMALDDTAEEFKISAPARFRSLHPLYLISTDEWEAYLAWQARLFLAAEGQPDSDTIDFHRLRQHLEQAEKQLLLPPAVITTETVSERLYRWFQGNGDDSSATAAEQLAVLLPQLHCGACGTANCHAFAKAILFQTADLGRCPHLGEAAAARLRDQVEVLRLEQDPQRSSGSFLQLLFDRQGWRTSPRRAVFQRVLSPVMQHGRRLLVERIREAWEELANKPQIFKRPDPETFYRQLCDHLGKESTECLRPDEKEFLQEHGDLRLEAQWRMLQAQQDWLRIARRYKESRPLFDIEDPARVAENGYRSVFYLHQLSQRDRRLVLQRRFEKHQDDFSHWWNEDLLTMNHPDFSIRNWDDFTKIIKNAYWHQERSLLPSHLAVKVAAQVRDQGGWQQLREDLVHHWIDLERDAIDSARKIRQNLDGDGHPCRIRQLGELRDLLAALAMGAFSQGLPPENATWDNFQRAAVRFDPSFSCSWDELTAREQEALKAHPDSGGLNVEQFFPITWNSPLQHRVVLIRCLIQVIAADFFRLQAESRLVSTAMDSGRSPQAQVNAVRRWLRERMAAGTDPGQLRDRLLEGLQRDPAWQDELLGDALHRLIAIRQYETLRRQTGGVLPLHRPDPDWSSFIDAHPHWIRIIDDVIALSPRMDRDRLLRSLFLLAKMEGDIDVLTALLREIRKTSDIIEAAWLNFTQQRLEEGPFPRTLPGTAIGIPLLASKIKDKSVIERALRKGLARGEKRSVAAAVNELLLYIRYHILTRPGAPAQRVQQDLFNAGYDLTGIEPDAIGAAVVREWQRREQLHDDRISIVTAATARRLCAQNPELQEAERKFHKIRLDILKDDGKASGDREEILKQRGIALGKIKEALYRELSDLLEQERISSFRTRIEQIVSQLDLKRLEIYESWMKGHINRRSIFYLLRSYQKQNTAASWDDCQGFLADHWFHPVEELRRSNRADRQERIRELDEQIKALLGISLVSLEEETRQAADQEYQAWKGGRLASLRDADGAP